MTALPSSVIPKHTYRVKQLGSKYIVVTLGNTRVPGFYRSRRHALNAVDEMLKLEGGIPEQSEAAKAPTVVDVKPKPSGGTVEFNLEPTVAPIVAKVEAIIAAPKRSVKRSLNKP